MHIDKNVINSFSLKIFMFSLQKTFSKAKKYGLKLPRQKIVEKETEAKKFAKSLGYPVVIKIASSGHKTESGGVFTGVRKEDFVSKFRKLKKKSGSILIQEQIDGVEAIAGGISDKQFGPCVSFGTGGIFVEIMKDVNFRVCPIRKGDAKELVKESLLYQILKGSRGKKYDLKSVEKTLMSVSEIMVREDLNEMDINPLICNEKGAWAVDVRMG